MKFFPIILFALFINFSAFAFIPTESNSAILVSEKNTSKSEVKKVETQKSSTSITSTEPVEKLEANKLKMNFKERLAFKFRINKLNKVEKQQSKQLKFFKESKERTTMGKIIRFLGITFIVLVIAAIVINLTVLTGE